MDEQIGPEHPDQSNGLALLFLLAATVAVPVLGWRTIPNWHADDEPWRGWLLALVLGVVAAAGGWLKQSVGTVSLLSIVVTVMFCIDSATKPETGDADLWPLGAVFIFIGALLGLGAVAMLARLVRLAVDREHRRGDA